MNRNLTATILIVLSLGLYFTVTTKILADAKNIQNANVKYISALDNAKKLISVREKVLKDYKNISQEDRARLEKMLPKSVDNIRLIIDLSSVAKKHGFVLKNIKTQASKQADAKGTLSTPVVQNLNIGDASGSNISAPILDTVTVSFSISAPYQQFISFLQDLEANLRIMDISRLTATANDSGIYDWTIELKTYWLRSQ